MIRLKNKHLVSSKKKPNFSHECACYILFVKNRDWLCSIGPSMTILMINPLLIHCGS